MNLIEELCDADLHSVTKVFSPIREEFSVMDLHLEALAEPISDWPRYTPPAPSPSLSVVALRRGTSLAVEWGEQVQPKRRTQRTKPALMQRIWGWFR